MSLPFHRATYTSERMLVAPGQGPKYEQLCRIAIQRSGVVVILVVTPLRGQGAELHLARHRPRELAAILPGEGITRLRSAG